MPAILALLAAAVVRAAPIESLPPAPPEPLAPSASATLPGSLAAPLGLGYAATDINAFGAPGPGVQAEHVAALQALADKLKTPVFVHGSRQTGVRKTGEVWDARSDLNVGVVGDAQAFLRAARQRGKFLEVPDVSKEPALRRDSIVEAVHAGHFVVAPSARAQAAFRADERQDHLSGLARPWRTETQLAKLAAAPRAPQETFKFAVIGDAEPGRFRVWRWLWGRPGMFERQLADAEKRGTDFIVQLGDMVSRGTKSHFARFFETLARVAPRTPYLTVIGNHDRHKPHGVSNDREYRSLFGPTDYFFDRGGWRFVTLDSSAGRLTRAQLEWLDRALDTELRTVVFTHMMPAAIRDATVYGGAFAMGGFKEGSDAFARLVSRRGVERVYVGHIHALGARDYMGVRYVLTGGGGSPLYPTGGQNVFHHYLTVEAGPDGLRETAHLPDGSARGL